MASDDSARPMEHRGSIHVACEEGHDFDVRTMYAGMLQPCPECGVKVRVPSDAVPGLPQRADVPFVPHPRALPGEWVVPANLSAYAGWIWLSVPLFASAILVKSAFLGKGFRLGLGSGAAILTPLLVLLILRKRGTVLALGRGYLAEIPWLGRRRQFTRGDIVTVARRSVRPADIAAPFSCDYVLGESNRLLLRLDHRFWDQADLDRIWNSLGVAVDDGLDHVLTSIELEREFPGIWGSWRRAVAIVVVMLALFAAWIALAIANE